MSYRTVKKLLGETSLERKCLFLFGSSLILLIAGSFYVYAQLNLRIIRSQYRQRAQLLIAQNLQMTHWAKTQEVHQPETLSFVKDLSSELKPEELREYNWKFIPEDYENSDPTRRPTEKFETEALNRLLHQNEPFVFHEDDEEGKYHYFEPILASRLCLQCHAESDSAQTSTVTFSPTIKSEGQVMGMARLTFELIDTQRDIARNSAILVAMAIVTAFLSMTVAYFIIRYIVVKPVMHLKDVSDAIAHGELDQRADIKTGDEFQELSHAFNRMLRHLVTTQEELKDVNTNLDAKVDELARANLSLHELNNVKNEFLATMSHELRTPLNSILGFSEVLEGAENLSTKQQKYITNIRTSGNNLLTLIDDILDLAKIEAGRMEIHISRFSLGELLERLTSSMRPLAEKKNISLRCDVDERVDDLTQDAGKLQQVVYNLLANAVKFTPEGGRIHITANPENDEEFLELAIEDTGIGIPLEDQQVIFEKFRQGKNPRGDAALTREYEGTGLGLSIVKELSKLLGGEVSLTSEFGRGSRFAVRLPLELVCETKFDTDDPRLSATSEMIRQATSMAQSPKKKDAI